MVLNHWSRRCDLVGRISGTSFFIVILVIIKSSPETIKQIRYLLNYEVSNTLQPEPITVLNIIEPLFILYRQTKICRTPSKKNVPFLREAGYSFLILWKKKCYTRGEYDIV